MYQKYVQTHGQPHDLVPQYSTDDLSVKRGFLIPRLRAAYSKDEQVLTR